jgi:PAS domain S-box-containing protein
MKFFEKLKQLISKKNDKSTEQSRLWLLQTLDILPKPFFLVDFKKKQVSFTNAAARKMLGLDHANHALGDIYGREITLFDFDGNLVPLNELPSQRIIRGERLVGEEFVLSTVTGRHNIKIFSEDIPPMFGRDAAALIIFQDITALKKTETDLRRIQSELNEAVEIAQVGFWSVDLTSKKTNLSKQLMQQFGMNPDAFDGKMDAALNLIHPEDQTRVFAGIDQSLKFGTPYRMEYRVIRPDGTVRWIEAKSGKTGVKSVDDTRFAGTTLDITERMNARRALEASERELRLLADSMPQIVWSANPNGELDYFNQIWFDYSGSDLEANKGQGWTQFIHPEDLQLTIERWKKSVASSESYENEFRLRHHSGDYRWFVARARAIFKGDESSGRIVKKWYGTNTDIHDQKMLAEKLDEARSLAERANLAKSQFLANMSHEIRTPLGAIMGFSELIKDESLNSSERGEYVKVVERNSSQLLRIIDDILDLSKVEAGMMSIENIEFSLAVALGDFSSFMALKAREKGIRFSAKMETDLPAAIYSDPTRLRQILMNVVGNAIKFTDQGFVELRVKFVEGFLIFEVEDTGRGISKEQEQNLFQAFAQADASTTRKYGGTGLGLVLTRRLSRALGGDFHLKRSELGEGSVFTVRIKATAAPGTKLFSEKSFEDPVIKPTVPAGKLAGIKLLLVEDSPDNQALISIYLTKAGAIVDIASDGEQGLKLIGSKSYDIVLMDIQMPVMDGMTAIKKLRHQGYEKPVVALTAHAMKEERDRCLEAGFSDFLSKPVVKDELIQMVFNWQNKGPLGSSVILSTRQ